MAIRVRELSKTFQSREGGQVVALDNVSVDIENGEFVSLVGPSGCGKSTMLDLLAGLLEPTAGSAMVNGVDARERPPGLGFVFQTPVLLAWRTVFDNIYLPAKVGSPPAEKGDHSGALKDRARMLLEMVGLSGFEDKYPWELSGGMQSRVAIARALVLETRVLCMDEPFAALDEFTREQMHEELLSIWTKQRFSTVFVTHNIFEAVFLSDRVLLMTPRPGQIVADISIDLPRPRAHEMIGSAEFSANLTRVRESMAQHWEVTA